MKKVIARARLNAPFRGSVRLGIVQRTRGELGMTRQLRASMALAALAAISVSARAGDLGESLKKGQPDLKSAGALAFGPEGILFVGDSRGGAVFAFDTGDDSRDGAGPVDVPGLGKVVADMLGTQQDQVIINDVAVNPASGRVYVSADRGRGPEAQPVLLRVEPAGGKVVALELEELPFAKTELPSLPDAQAKDERGRSPRAQAITDLAFVDGRVFVAGLSNEEFSSRLLAVPFPFSSAGDSASIEIYHGAHGRFETRSPVRTFLATELKGEPTLLAAYTCTPLVKIPVSQLQAGSHVKGTTIAELGNRNNPLDMVAYEKDGQPLLLIANNSRGVMKVKLTGAESAEGIVNPINGTAGQPYETVAELKGVTQLDKLDDTHAVIVTQSEDGSIDLKTIELP